MWITEVMVNGFDKTAEQKIVLILQWGDMPYK